MSQFKRFNASENDNYNSSDAYPEGTLTWDPSNGLRIHDGNTSGGNAVSASTGYTRFLGSGIGSYDTNNSTSYDMVISPNWDGDFTGNVSITLPSNENFGSPLQIVHNSTGGVQIITQNNATWTFGADGNLTAPGNVLSTSGTFTSSGDNDIVIRAEKGLGAPGGPGFVDWTFGVLGDLTLPEGGDILDSNGNSVLGGGGGGTTLPLDAAGVLKNDGTGTLSWSSLDIQDLTDNGNLLNFTQQQANWEELNAASPAYIQNKPMLVTSYNDLADKPDLFNGDYLSLTGTPSLANVATTGEYGDLINTPTSLSDFTNDPGFISASDLAVSTGGSGSLTYSNGLFTYEGPTVPTDISELTDNTNLLSSGGTTLPADASGYLNNNGSGTLSWVPGNPSGSGLLPYSDVKVLSDTTTADWSEFTLSGTMDSMNDYSNSIATITLTSSTAYGKTITANTKNLWVTNAKVNSNDYLVVEFPPSPTVGDIFSVVPVAVTQTVTAGSFVIGETYTIVTVGSTNFTTIGAAMNGTGQVFVATGAGTGTGTATTSAGAKKLIYKPAAGQRARTMYVGNNPPVMFGQGGAYDFVYVDLGGQYANQPATWVYAGLVDSIPTWYHTYF